MSAEDDEILRVKEVYDKKNGSFSYDLHTRNYPRGGVRVHIDSIKPLRINGKNSERELVPIETTSGYQKLLIEYAKRNPHLLPGLLCVMLFLLPQFAPFKIQFMHDMFLEKIKFVTSSRIS
jgi:hypothetical protein